MHSVSSGTIRVFLLDDHDIVRRGLRDLLAPARDIHVVGESRAVQGAATTILELQVGVMILDLHLQDGTGIDVCRQVRSADPSVQGLLLTAVDDDEALVSAVLAGASGYAVKVNSNIDLIGTVRKLGAGVSLLAPAATERAARLLNTRSAGIAPPLSSYQRQLLSWVFAGLTDREIADRTGTSVEVAAAEVSTLVGLINPTLERDTKTPRPTEGRHRREVD